MKENAILYVKSGCPWCIDAESFLKRNKIPYTRREVLSDAAAMKEMVELSGQRKAPTMKLGNDVLADFGVDELIPFLKKRGVVS
ncbi:glutaredoxin family protein [Pelagicoccus sp. SDUM812003]|uniref:glutaredoxin family protein n=1 Tax=Pelagicoccus sp. SDUM812003 TaxID=3041267 RepID=UPI00280D07B9|nr:glutaredoxin family protein [Pelagicoccus sp. SDUM812003]MDQ8202998.1 glutaredoxin family protein [Pelagicoccus sp. SDUM812003]